MTPSRSLRSLRSLPLAVVLCGCYTYAPVDANTVARGASVRARVTSSAAERIAPLLGEPDPRVVVGSLVERSNGRMIIEVPTTTSSVSRSAIQTLYQRVALAPADVTEMETRTLNRTRTAIIVGAAVIVAGSIAAASLHGEPAGDRPPTGSPPETRIPVIRFRF